MAKLKSGSDALSPSDIQECSPKAKVQCVVTGLSEMKNTRGRDSSYYDGEISDGKTCIRVTGTVKACEGSLSSTGRRKLPS